MDLQIDDVGSLPLRLTAVARSGTASSAAHVEQWDGATISLPLPSGSSLAGLAALDVVAYGRNDWHWVGTRIDVPTKPRDDAEDVRRAVELLPASSLALPRQPRLFGRASWIEHAARVALDGSTEQLQVLARATAGAGDDHTRAWRLARRLRSAVVPIPGDVDLVTPATALRSGQCGVSSWALCFASAARAARLVCGCGQTRRRRPSPRHSRGQRVLASRPSGVGRPAKRPNSSAPGSDQW